MLRTPKRPITGLTSIVCGTLCPSPADAAFTTTGIYDNPNNGNVVDVSATSDSGVEISLASFTALVDLAYQADAGGVIDFDNGSLTGPNTIDANLGVSQSKSITITDATIGTFEISSPASGAISGNASMRKTLGKMRIVQEAVQTGLIGYQQSIEKLLIEFRKVQNAQTPQKYLPAPAKPVPIQQVAKTVSTSGNGDIPSFGTGELKVLTAIAQHQEGVTREQITVLTGYKRSSRDTYLHRLRSVETIELRGDRIFVTQIGIDVLGHNFSPLPTGEELRDYWQRRLPGGEKKLFEVIINAYPDAVDRQQLDEATGYKRSSRDTFLHRLRNRQLIEVHGTAVRASERLF